MTTSTKRRLNWKESKTGKRKSNSNIQNLQINILNSLYKIYQQLNEELFGNLPRCQIVFFPFYNDCYANVFLGKHPPFITFNTDFFHKGSKFIVGILLHEMVHIHCFENKINDVNYVTGYHNSRFKHECNNIGLICLKDANGFNVTKVSKKLNSLLQKIEDIKDLEIMVGEYL